MDSLIVFIKGWFEFIIGELGVVSGGRKKVKWVRKNLGEKNS